MKFFFPILSWLMVVFTMVSCSDDQNKSTTSAQKITPSIKVDSRRTPEATVHGFLTWYGQNREKLGSLPLVPAAIDDIDTTTVFAVDFKAADEYLAILDSSSFISRAYLANERRFMQKADSIMHKNLQKSGTAEAFSYDRVVFSQGPDSDLKLLARTKPVVTIRGDTARVFFPQLPQPKDLRDGADLEFLLTQHHGKWLIENIRPVFTD